MSRLIRLKKQVYKSWHRLWSTVQDEITEGHFRTLALANKHSPKKKAEEPDFIATLVLDSIPSMVSQWESILSSSGISLSMVSVFCHQRPLVKHALSSKMPEIGDLLVVHVHHPRNGRSRRRAILFQAKRSKKLSLSISKNDHQLVLYENWPTFSFRRPSLPGTRDVYPKHAHAGAKYLLIDDGCYLDRNHRILSRCGLTPYFTAWSSSQLAGNRSLSTELVKLLALEAGKSIYSQDAAMKRKDWTRVVWDLLEMSVGTNFNRRNIDFGDRSRIAGWNLNSIHGIRMALLPFGASTKALRGIVGKNVFEALASFDGSGDVPEDTAVLTDDDSGISTVFLETADEEVA